MNIAIVGAGIVGLSTALELAHDGHQITLYEQLNAIAEGASFAPGGWLQPCVLSSLAAPGCGMSLNQLRQGRNPLLSGSALPGSSAWRWLRQWKHNEQHAQNHPPGELASILASLGHYSQEVRWGRCTDPDAQAERKIGALVLLRTAKTVDEWQQRLAVQAAIGINAELLDPQQVRDMEPNLGADISFAGGLYLPEGESINSRLWSQHLRQTLQTLDVRLWTGVHVERVHAHPIAVQAQGQNVPYDAVVLCTGAQLELVTALGIKLPMMPVWGYSISAPVRDMLQTPHGTVMDWEEQAYISRLGQRMRITAGAELAGAPQAPLHQGTLQRMYQLLNDWFPGSAQLSSQQVQLWRGVRGVLPDGLPAVGATGQPGIWLNLAHGSHGVSLAAGCARVLADMVRQTTPALDVERLQPLRFG